MTWSEKNSIEGDLEKKDWHDWNFIEYEKTRKGPGEHGEPFFLTDARDIELNQKLLEEFGLCTVVNDKVSVNRSIPDTRPSKCADMKYLKNLPKTSVIVIFFNEYFSLIMRTIHSIYNRTPHELLHEVLLVNDGSTNKDLYEPLRKYVMENFDGRVKIVDLPNRKGLIVARMEGARKATGEVLVFLDAHMEVNVNWLPPLLEPIVINPHSSTVALADGIMSDTLNYKSAINSRGVFDWKMIYRFLPPFPEDLEYPERPASIPVMLGSAFAIRKDYFFHLGGYDENLLIWNGENYELSFKLWLCGGQILLVSCSRIGHMFKSYNKYRSVPGVDFIAHNFKRIAEVWMDDYKEIIYRNDPTRYANVNAGDLTKQKQLRQNLNCKPFQYFFDEVAPDLLKMHPMNEPGIFASGTIQSEANLKLCIDAIDRPPGTPIGLLECDKNLTHPKISQSFIFSWHRHIKKNLLSDDFCFDRKYLGIGFCNFKFKTQLWFYNLTTHQIINPQTNTCLTAVLSSKTLKATPCRAETSRQRWLWGYTNTSALENWSSFGVKVPKLISKKWRNKNVL